MSLKAEKQEDEEDTSMQLENAKAEDEEKPDHVLPRDHGADMPTEATFYEIACAALSAELKRHGGPAQHLPNTQDMWGFNFFDSFADLRPEWLGLPTTARRCQTWTQRQSSSWGFATWASCPNAVRSQTRNCARRSNWRWIFEAYFHYFDWCFGNSSNAQLATTTTPSFGTLLEKDGPCYHNFVCGAQPLGRNWDVSILHPSLFRSMQHVHCRLLELMHLR